LPSKFLDMINQKYGRLTVLEYIGVEQKHGGRVWKCGCDCGGFKEVTRNALVKGQTKSCGCLEIENRIKQSHNFTGKYSTAIEPGMAGINQVYGWYKRSAKIRGLSFEINKEDFLILTKLNCYYCGIPPSTINDYSDNGKCIYNGLDRKDNTVGYTLENVAPCCKECNYIKGPRNSNEFIIWLRRAGAFAIANH
jgi:hypothetical protein